jgi:hypothetical protein
MEDDLYFFENLRRPQFLTLEDELNFLKMEDDLNFFENGRRPKRKIKIKNVILTNSTTLHRQTDQHKISTSADGGPRFWVCAR